MEKIDSITKDGKILAIVIYRGIQDEIKFATPDTFPFQIGVQNRKANTKVEPHRHPPFEDVGTLEVQEFFHMISGKMKVILYDENDQKFQEIILESGDSIVLNCGHGVEFIDDSHFIEIKQGPYRGRDQEKKMIK